MCKNDVCCMAFEWSDDACTLKSRSLNGTIEAKEGAHFALCLDYGKGDGLDELDATWDRSSKEGGRSLTGIESYHLTEFENICAFGVLSMS